jgi:hypothetical protein
MKNLLPYIRNVVDIPLFVYIHTIDIRLDNIVMPLARQVGRADRASISGSKFSHHSACAFLKGA